MYATGAACTHMEQTHQPHISRWGQLLVNGNECWAHAEPDSLSLFDCICSVVLPWGSIFSRGRGSRDDNVHTVTSGARFVKSSEVTPKLFVSKAPRVEPVKDPPFSTLIKVANRVASTPCMSESQLLRQTVPWKSFQCSQACLAACVCRSLCGSGYPMILN